MKLVRILSGTDSIIGADSIIGTDSITGTDTSTDSVPVPALFGPGIALVSAPKIWYR